MVVQLDEELWFPDPHVGDPDGMLAVGGDLSIDRLLLAYSHGIFPWFSFTSRREGLHRLPPFHGGTAGKNNLPLVLLSGL